MQHTSCLIFACKVVIVPLETKSFFKTSTAHACFPESGLCFLFFILSYIYMSHHAYIVNKPFMLYIFWLQILLQQLTGLLQDLRTLNLCYFRQENPRILSFFIRKNSILTSLVPFMEVVIVILHSLSFKK